MYKIEYIEITKKDIALLSPGVRPVIQKAITEKLTTSPEIFGKPLKHSLHPLRSLRVGKYRVIFLIKKNSVWIWGILPRENVYPEVIKRR
jgi:mRNA-degrading endonuclease RelE of RelBE toxin-antitoxin system